MVITFKFNLSIFVVLTFVYNKKSLLKVIICYKRRKGITVFCQKLLAAIYVIE